MSAWVSLPPLISIPIAAALFLLGGQTEQVGIGAPFWALLMIIYVLITGVYALAIIKDLMHLLPPLQLLSQGLIIAGMSLTLGVFQIMSWIGVISVVSGAIILLNFFLRFHGRQLPEEEEYLLDDQGQPSGSNLDTIPVPALTVDSTGKIVEANSAFLAIAPGSEEQGAQVTSFLIPGEQTATLGQKSYAVFQAPKGEVFFFALVELPAKIRGANLSAPGGAGLKLIDDKTGLYTPEYASIRIPEELGRAFRYRRWLSSVLLAVDFSYNPGMNYEQELEKKFMKAFAIFVRSVIRASDMAFILDERKILLLLPETPQQGAKEVSIKLKILPESIEEMIDSLPFSVGIKHGFIYYSGNHALTQEQLLEKVHSELDKKKE